MNERGERAEPRLVLPPEDRTAPPRAARAVQSAKASAAASAVATTVARRVRETREKE